MPIYQSRALLNITHMVPGHEKWKKYSNDLWHWFKHAGTLHLEKVVISPEISGLRNEEQYLALAREVCRKAAAGLAGTEVKVREATPGQQDGLLVRDYLVWYDPPGTARGLFLVVRDSGDHGELVTMFPPVEGRAYFDDQSGSMMQ